MATRPTFQRPEEDDANVSSTYNLGGLAGGSSIAGPSNTATPNGGQTAPPAGSATSRFVSFDRMLDANAGNAQRAADNVASGVTDKVNTAFNTQDSFLNGTAQTAVNNGVTGERWLSQAQDGTYYVAGGKPFSYTGPTNVNEVGGYENVANAFADARSAVSSLGNRRQGGVNALTGTSPGTGNGRLTGALVNAKGGSRFDQLFNQWTKGDGSLDSREQAGVTRFDDMVEGGRNAANQREADLEADAAYRNLYRGYEMGGQSGDNQGRGIDTPGTTYDPPPKNKKRGDSPIDRFFRTIIPN